MSYLLATAAHVLGLIGMAGVWLVPSRLWQLVARRQVLYHGARQGALAVALLCSVALSLYVAADALPRVFRCLWEGWCTATRGGALLNLAVFGSTVLLVEIAWFAYRTLSPRWGFNVA